MGRLIQAAMVLHAALPLIQQYDDCIEAYLFEPESDRLEWQVGKLIVARW